ncbi:threonine/serine exporter family protein [Scopulibacillus cellulosilyticus]|uniref:Threonine/serine exporter family protein n=1 Tax=Scopulibacillus cellulosilyticus TaxID=2665665 RepID=A0ABW2Q100_9BACL
MIIIEQMLTSFVASGAFGIIFNMPQKSLIKCGLVGMIGWMLYFLLFNNHVNNVIASFVAAFFVAAISQFFAKRYKTPVIVFSVAGIIPLVPGSTAYDAMRHIVENDYNTAIQLATKAFMVSGAIAVGLVFSEVINQLINKFKHSKRSKTTSR